MSGQEAKEKGNTAFKSGDFAAAIGHYTAAILADPKNATYPLNRAAAYLKLGKNEDAERDCTRVVELDSKNVKGWFRRGQARSALSRLEDAKKDFERVLQLEPKNDAAQQELKKVSQAILNRDAKLKKKTPLDIGITSSAGATPRRRRVPITIIDSDIPTPSNSVDGALSQKNEELLQPVSSRTLEGVTSSTASVPLAVEPSDSRNNAPKKPTTFKEAKKARESQQSRPGGGIFRRDGQHTLFDTRPKPPTPSAATSTTETKTEPDSRAATPPSTAKPTSSQAAPEPVKPQTIPSLVAAASSMTLFNFNRNWDSLKSPDMRWQFLQQIPPTSLPSLFKTSLEASNLVSILQTFQHVLQNTSTSPATKNLIREYLINLARVSRFNTLVLFLCADERRLAREVWNASEEGGVTDAPERRAWGLV